MTHKGSLSVLLVEDELLIAETMRRILTRANHKVLMTATNVSDALEMIVSSVDDIDVALLDLNLRGESSAPIAKKLESACIPYVIVTGYSEADVLAQGIKGQMIIKPFRSRQLVDAVTTAYANIRFYAQDTSRPFVEVVAHSFADAAPSIAELDRLRDCIRSEWSMFEPLDLRLRALPGRIKHPAARTDVTIHAARHRDMTPPDRCVHMMSFADLDTAIEIVHNRYQQLSVSSPDLARNISAADTDDLHAWHAADQLRAIVAEGTIVGLLAIAPGNVAWIDGDEVKEEVVMAAYSGRGYAASAQASWAATVAPDRHQVVVGTIDRLNPASRRTAERVGRPAVLEEVFIDLA